MPQILGNTRGQQNLPARHPLRSDGQVPLKIFQPPLRTRALGSTAERRETAGWGGRRQGLHFIIQSPQGHLFGETAEEANFLTSSSQWEITLSVSLAGTKGSPLRAAVNSKPQKACGWTGTGRVKCKRQAITLPHQAGEHVGPNPASPGASGSPAPPHPTQGKAGAGCSLLHVDGRPAGKPVGTIGSMHSADVQ